MKAITDYPDYFISKKGRVFSKRKNGILTKCTPALTNKGRYRVTLYNEEGKKQFQISRLVAKAYIDNPKNYPFVLHKDNNPLNNNDWNLVWGNQSQNIKQAYRDGRAISHFKKKITQSNRDRVEILKNKGYTQMEIATKIHLSKMSVRRIIYAQK